MPTGPVTIEIAVAEPLAAVAERVAPGGVASRFRDNLDKVYAFLKTNGDVRRPGAHNVFVYPGSDDETARDTKFPVMFGVQVARPFTGEREVFCTATPAGRMAKAVHIGPYDRIRETQRVIRAWCVANGHGVAGPSWEIYGDWNDDPSKLETTVCYLLR